MFGLKHNTLRKMTGWLMVGTLALALAPLAVAKKDKKKDQTPAKAKPEQPQIDTSKLVWPAPPDIARIRWAGEFRAELRDESQGPAPKKKASWMDRVAGIKTTDDGRPQQDVKHILLKPYGVAVDSKGRAFVADSVVGAIFIFDFDQKKTTLIRNGAEAHFKTLIGLAIDDADRLFAVDSGLHHVTVFDADGKLVNIFGDDQLGHPGGVAVDNENRFVYVVDTEKENVAVFDADSFQYLRSIGGHAKNVGDEDPGTFAKPSNVAVDEEGNVYVTDTMNNRVQVFDGDGHFIRMFGKQGDGPGYFARPKGIALDSDGHVWVVDAFLNRVQIYDKEGHLLAYFGTGGTLTGQLGVPAGIAIDKKNRVFVTEQLKGRMQMFQYVPDKEAAAEKAKRGGAAPAAGAETASAPKS